MHNGSPEGLHPAELTLTHGLLSPAPPPQHTLLLTTSANEVQHFHIPRTHYMATPCHAAARGWGATSCFGAALRRGAQPCTQVKPQQVCADLSIEGEGKGGFGEGKRGKVPANISGHRLYAKHRAGVVSHTYTHTYTHTHTHQPRGAVERARQIQSRFLVPGLGKFMNLITGDEICKGPGTQEALSPFTLHSPTRGKASFKLLDHLPALISDRARSAFTQNCIQLPRAS